MRTNLEAHPPLARLASAGGVVDSLNQADDGLLPCVGEVLTKSICKCGGGLMVSEKHKAQESCWSPSRVSEC
jgi:hypothetical protein